MVATRLRRRPREGKGCSHTVPARPAREYFKVRDGFYLTPDVGLSY
jgi:hypothetical protein